MKSKTFVVYFKGIFLMQLLKWRSSQKAAHYWGCSVLFRVLFMQIPIRCISPKCHSPTLFYLFYKHMSEHTSELLFTRTLLSQAIHINGSTSSAHLTVQHAYSQR